MRDIPFAFTLFDFQELFMILPHDSRVHLPTEHLFEVLGPVSHHH